MNSKKLLLALIFFAQTSMIVFSRQNFQKGLLILNNGDSISCLIGVYDTNIFINSGKIIYRINDKKKKIKTNAVSMIKFDNMIYEKLTFVRQNQVQEGPRMVWVNYDELLFAALVKNGNINLYKHYFFESSGTIVNSNYISYETYLDSNYYIKKNGNLIEINKFGFKVVCKELFIDCYQAIEKLDNKEFNYENIEDMVDFVNIICY